jgi:hypothetical protein
MGLLDGLEPHKKARNCRIRAVLVTLEKKDVEILQNALNQPEIWTAKGLSNALKVRGLLVSDNVISNHRKGACSCGKID